MSRFYPHPAYAEDQPLAHTILITHCLHRGFTTGGIIGLSIGAARSLLRSQPFLPTVLRSTGVGAAIGTAFLALGVTGRMWGREEIEWKDRSWRLLANEGQVGVDDWSLSGMGIGATTVALGLKGLGWRGVLGGAATGSVLGMLGYMGLGTKGGGNKEAVEAGVGGLKTAAEGVTGQKEG